MGIGQRTGPYANRRGAPSQWKPTPTRASGSVWVDEHQKPEARSADTRRRRNETPMSHTKSRILIHMVFATVERKPIITPKLKPDLHAYMAGTARELGVFLHALGGVEDHCHLVFDLPPKLALASFADQLKSNTSRWAGRDFGWQRGYGAFSVNHSSLERAVGYVLTQEEHHRQQSFREELAEFLRVHEMESDSEFIDGIYTP